MKATTHIHFNGNCREALRFYEKCFGGKTKIMTWGESPEAKNISPDWKEKVIHANFEVDGQMLITADDPPPGYYNKPQGFDVLLDFNDVNEAEKVFKALSEKAEIRMPFAETFWARRFGMLVDQFGIPWMINCSKPMA